LKAKENKNITNSRFNFIYFADHYHNDILAAFGGANSLRRLETIKELNDVVSGLSVYELDVNILIEVNANNLADAMLVVSSIKNNWLTRNLVVIFLLTEKNPIIVQQAFKARVADCYSPDFSFEDVSVRLNSLSAFRLLNEQLRQLPDQPLEQYKIPFLKRALDILLSGTALLLLSPIFLILAICIKLDSKGPVVYKSRRVGTGYKIFSFYKFRSMRSGADKEVEALKNTQANQYGESAFFKMKDDPRITKLGSFLRSSSIDELPQLFNVLRGDMSLVGNRPLPLYEAEQLTTNEWSMRFLGPAGITGLWQIIKRGKSDMSDRERKKLDNFYIKKFSIWLDVKIILKTIPVLFQKEKV
jgi:lipopolysaccharide/colanic/teichoic acid biosynthesis glycosyltransferase